MRYEILETIFDSGIRKIINIDLGNSGVNFPAVVSNPNYDAFLVSAKLTDEEVHALEVDVWYDFPVEL